MSRYIDADKLTIYFEALAKQAEMEGLYNMAHIHNRCLQIIEDAPPADVVEVVRCRDCKHFQPCFVRTADGERRPYTDEEIKNGKMVTGDVGINCGSRCERFGYWEENKIPVWYNENDYCSYGERSANGT